MLTRAGVQAHERKLLRILLGDLVAVAMIAAGIALPVNGAETLALLGIAGVVVQGFRGWGYMMKDLRLRGRSPAWSLGLGGPFGFVAWLIWRRSHPIPTRD